MSDIKEPKYHHPGGKLWELGPESLTDTELLTILIGTGSPGKPAKEIAEEIIDKYYSIYGLMGKPLKEITKIKGLKKAKVIKIAAAFELARRIVKHWENWGK